MNVRNIFKRPKPAPKPGGRVGRGVLRSYLPYLCVFAVVLALLACLFLETVLAAQTVRVQSELAALAGKRSPSIFTGGGNLSSRPAKVNFSAFAVEETNPDKAAKEPSAEAKPIDLFTLVGTIPPIGAWINVEGILSLVLRTQEFNGYVLEIVEAGRILFVRDGENYPLYLNYAAKVAPAPKPQTTAQDTAEGGNPGVQVAEYNGQEGAITRELLQSLLSNPYDEIAKIRLVPEGTGMMIRSMRPDSLLLQLGVKQGDVLTGINGIPITDVSNILNAINSMLTGSRLDFNVTREEAPGTLGYIVK